MVVGISIHTNNRFETNSFGFAGIALKASIAVADLRDIGRLGCNERSFVGESRNDSSVGKYHIFKHHEDGSTIERTKNVPDPLISMAIHRLKSL